jgi:UPF0716 protein FxsA
MLIFTGRMILPLLIAGPILEIAAFVFVAQSLGFGGALAGLALVSFLGMAVLRRQGMSFLAAMRMGGPGAAENVDLGDRVLAGLGGLLLALPGYLSGIAGALLLIGPLRRRTARLVRRRAGTAQPSAFRAGEGVIDLDADEFRHSQPSASTAPAPLVRLPQKW